MYKIICEHLAGQPQGCIYSVKGLQSLLLWAFVSLFWSSYWLSSIIQLTTKELLWYSVIQYVEDMTCPSELRLTQQGKYVWETGMSKHFHISDFFQPLYMHYPMITSQVDLLQMSRVSLISGPGLTTMYEMTVPQWTFSWVLRLIHLLFQTFNQSLP